MADSDPMDATSYSTQPPAAPLSADEIAEMRERVAKALAMGFYTHERANLSETILRDMPRLLSALEALTAENARLTSKATALDDLLKEQHGVVREAINAAEKYKAERDRLRDTLNQTVQEACAAIDDDLKPEIARLTSELGKYAMPPWEADRHKREALAARRALCLGEHADNVAPADIHDRIIALRTAKEAYREDVR